MAKSKDAARRGIPSARDGRAGEVKKNVAASPLFLDERPVTGPAAGPEVVLKYLAR
jgi:hypothetical protein